ncbi:MAG: hypothetical protein ABJN95_16205 [Maribacter sp.]|uniref:hypothetical protein n=1 Tax=Maribacter sp. TaxID=1897614 RepID=UPI0032996700
MNDLSKKEATPKEDKATTKENSLLQKKLESYLLLSYQAYLKGETVLAPEIRTAFLSRVKQNEELAFKVRMLQLDYLHLENLVLEGPWDELTELLFPKIEALDKPLEEGRQHTLDEYSDTILALLNSSS